jgi:hemerythrin-like domain-containing protein
MDAVRMLVHDHGVLTSQVEHVGALVKGLLDKTFSPEALHDELLQQIELLRDQMLEHFGFEEEAAFPFIVDVLPEQAVPLRSLIVAHEQIARQLVSVVELLGLTNKDTLGLQVGPIASTFDRFLNVYRSHVSEEVQFLDLIEE